MLDLGLDLKLSRSFCSPALGFSLEVIFLTGGQWSVFGQKSKLLSRKTAAVF